VFTGRIDTTEGDTESLTSRIVDATDQLDRPVSLDPVAHTMPGAYDETTDIAEPPVKTFVQPWHAAYRAMRAAGFGIAAPTQVGGSRILDVDFQGSIWPALGNLHYDSLVDTSLDWGEGWTFLSEGSVRYQPRRVQIGSGEGVRVWSRIAAIPGQTARTLLRYDSERHVRVDPVLNSARTELTVTIEVWDGVPTSGGTLISSGSTTVPAIVEDGSVWLDVLLPAGSSTARLAVATTGATTGTPNSAVETPISVGTALPSGTAYQIAVRSPLIGVRAGVQTLAQWRAMSSQMPRGAVRAWGRGLVNSQYVSRTQVKRNARDLLAEIGAATLTAMWIDELGVMQWAPSDLMYARSPDTTVTTADDVFSLGWMESMQACRRKVYADFQNASVSISANGYTKRLYQPDRAQDITGATETEFVEVPDDREWLGVDMSMWRASAVQDRYNEGKGSFYSAVIEGADDSWTSVGADYSAALERITPRTYKLTHTNATGTTVTLMTHPTAPGFRLRRRGEANPIIRGQGSAWFVDETVTAEETGPSWAGDMTVNLGAWAIRDHAQRIANWLGTELGRPLVTLTDMEIAYDPRIQLGDVLRIESRDFLGFSLDAIVIGKRETHGDGAQMSVTVRVLRTHTVHTTYAEFEAAYQGRTYQALETAWNGATYQAFEYGPTTR